MGSTWLLVAVLVGPEPEFVSFAEGAARQQLGRWSREDWRAAVRNAWQRNAVGQHPDPADAVPELVGLYVALADAEAVPPSERAADRRRVKFRLEQLRDDLLRGQARARQKSTGTTLRGGGATPPGAQALIQLIQTTIEPNSWSVNGGRGTIGYYTPLHALVVRQTAEQHHQLGDLLDALRR